jgi:hypothetical protein
MCSSSFLDSTSFSEAIDRADWTISAPPVAPLLHHEAAATAPTPNNTSTAENLSSTSAKQNVVFVTQTTILPSLIAPITTQIIRFGTGLEFLYGAEKHVPESNPSAVVLPCIFGARLEGPLLLATGKAPENIPFYD